MCFADLIDVVAAGPERDNTVVVVAAGQVAADTPWSGSSSLSLLVRRALGWLDRDTRTRCQSRDDRWWRRTYAAVNGKGVRTKPIETEKGQKQKFQWKKSGHACDSLDFVDEGLGHLDHHTVGLVLGM